MKMFSFRPLVGVTLAAVLGLSLNACSKDQSGNEPKLQELIIALDWVPNTNHTGLYVALDQGYFKEAGFDAKIVQPSEDSTSTLVANKRADFGVYFQPNMVKRLNKGEPITAVAAITQHSSAGLLSLAELDAGTPQDLQGKRYSTWEDPVDDAVVEQVVGAPLNKIPGESTDATTALRMNQFDYIMAYYSWDGIHAGIKGVDTNFFYLKDADPVFDYYAPLLIANNDALKNNPEKYKKALAAIKQGYLYAAHHPDESADILVKHAPEINVELAKKSQAYISPQYLDEQGDWGRFDYDRWDRFFNWVYQKGLMDEFTPKAGVTNDYLTQ
ncbi:ABC transporter substrate-binding protein [Moraxella canis]|uniref:Nitrate ABC transporter substrate-binding protein n=1 Tax=Moraxella canis TaxID=90239 RepID=A0A1S9ZMQ2_9GAMM|nr:ABC transporter substrate-binding protein [Moraxella canis]OOR84633.1 nitrate ABC transporter substrate-binding protein [Moraxella canis]